MTNTKAPDTPAAAEGLAAIIAKAGPIVIDWYGPDLAWRPLDYGTWTPLAALAPNTPPSEPRQPVEPAPVDDEINRAFIAGWNATLEYDDFDLALHYFMLAGITHVGSVQIAPTPKPTSNGINEDGEVAVTQHWQAALDLIDELYRKYDVELDLDDTAIAQASRNAWVASQSSSTEHDLRAALEASDYLGSLYERLWKGGVIRDLDEAISHRDHTRAALSKPSVSDTPERRGA